MIGVGLLVVSLVGLGIGGAFAATALGVRHPVDWLLGAIVLATVEATVLTIGVGAILRRYEAWALLVGVAAWAGAFGLVAAARGSVWEGPRGAYGAGARAARQLEWWQRLVVVVAIAALAWRVVLAVVLPPFAYDALVYHLPLVAGWIQGGRVGANEYAPCCSHYPAGAETLFAWPALFLENDLLVDAPQILLAVLGAAAVSALARWAGLGAESAATAGALFVLTPIVLTQSNTSYNDVAFAAFLLTAAYFVARLLDRRDGDPAPSLPYAVLAGVATGLTLGTKTSGIAVALVFACLVGTSFGVASARHRIAMRHAVAAIGVFVTAALLVGGWWYARNWVDTGNPVWPFRVSAAGLELFSGPARVEDYLDAPPGGERQWLVEVARSWYHDLDFWARETYWYEQRIGGLGPLWSWLGWAAVALLTLDSLRRRRHVAMNLILPLLLVFLLLPYKWWARFTIFLPAIGAIAVVALIARLRPAPYRRLVIAAVLVLTLAGTARASWKLDPTARGSSLSAVEILRLARHPLRDRHVGNLFYPEYAFLDDLPKSTSVAVEVEFRAIRFVYPLFGRGFDRKVTLLESGDERRLAARLAATGSKYVVVDVTGDLETQLADRPRRYERVVDERDVRVYRVRALQRAGSAPPR